jgi:AraC-like DNA-binding protein
VLSATEDVPLGDLHGFGVENFLGAFSSGAATLAGTDTEFEEVRVDYAPPLHRALLEKLFDCPIRFDCESVEIRLPTRLLDLPLDLSDPEATEACRRHCDTLLERLGARGGIVDRVRKHLLLNPGDFPDVGGTARHLGVSSRTLNRQLLRDGTSYLQILNDVRKELAIRYLRESDLNTDEIAERLGYAETTSFRRAFKRWTGKGTSSYRLG